MCLLEGVHTSAWKLSSFKVSNLGGLCSISSTWKTASVVYDEDYIVSIQGPAGKQYILYSEQEVYDNFVPQFEENDMLRVYFYDYYGDSLMDGDEVYLELDIETMASTGALNAHFHYYGTECYLEGDMDDDFNLYGFKVNGKECNDKGWKYFRMPSDYAIYGPDNVYYEILDEEEYQDELFYSENGYYPWENPSDYERSGIFNLPNGKDVTDYEFVFLPKNKSIESLL
jgi:hypothetical protein